MATHVFLSPDWIEAALVVRDEYARRGDIAMPAIRINLIVSDVPFDSGSAEASIDTSNGSTIPQLGLLPKADATITLDYRTAHTLLTGSDPQAAMMAFMTGQIRVDGDLAKVLALQQIDAPDSTRALAAEARQQILAITAPL